MGFKLKSESSTPRTYEMREREPDVPEHIANFIADNGTLYQHHRCSPAQALKCAVDVTGLDPEDCAPVQWLVWRANICHDFADATWRECVEAAWLRDDRWESVDAERKRRIYAADARRARLEEAAMNIRTKPQAQQADEARNNRLKSREEAPSEKP